MSETIIAPETTASLTPVHPIFSPAQLLDPAFDTVDTAGVEVDAALLEIVNTLIKKDEDPEQDDFITSLQKHRALLLKFATLAYMKKPSSAMMLIGKY